MSTWLLDLGHTRLKLARLQPDGRPGVITAVPHDGQRLPEGWDASLPPRFVCAVVSSVVHAGLRVQLLDALSVRCGRVSLASTLVGYAGLQIAYPVPARLGVDRFLALLAAHARQAGPCLVVGVGTALTVDLLDASGRHHGGRIAPAPALMRASLHQRAPHLPAAGGAGVGFASDTADALASGCEGAAVGLISHSMLLATQALGQAPQLLLHGGGAPALLQALAPAEHAPALVLEGLARWAGMEDAPAPQDETCVPE